MMRLLEALLLSIATRGNSEHTYNTKIREKRTDPDPRAMFVMRSIVKDLTTHRLLCTLHGTNASCRSLASVLQFSNTFASLCEPGITLNRDVWIDSERLDHEPAPAKRLTGHISPFAKLSTSVLCSKIRQSSRRSFSGSSTAEEVR